MHGGGRKVHHIVSYYRDYHWCIKSKTLFCCIQRLCSVRTRIESLDVEVFNDLQKSNITNSMAH